MSKKRWEAIATPDEQAAVNDRARAAAIGMAQADAAMRETEKLERTQVDRAMRQADAAMAAAGLRDGADYGPADAAMRETEKLARQAIDRAQADVERAMRSASRHEHRSED